MVVPFLVESGCGAVALGLAYQFPPHSSGGVSLAKLLLRFHIPLLRTGLVALPHPALGQDLTPSPTARRAQALPDV